MRRKSKGTIVIALGGNALILKGEKGTAGEQFMNAAKTARQVARIINAGYEVVLAHGNGPQVGNLLIQQKAGEEEVPAQPMDVCGAMSQGQIGYMLQQELGRLTKKPVVTVLTQVLVSEKDSAFKHPTKPVGPFYQDKRPGMVWDAGRGYRKVVPSPKPVKIVENAALCDLVKSGVILIACGGGGIPVVNRRGKLTGVEAVIDKDLAAEKLAEAVKADTLLILTAVPHVCLNYGTKAEKPIRKLNLPLARNYQREGQFPPGSMGPKIEAMVKFIQKGGKRAIVSSPEQAFDALAGKAGTTLVK